MMIPCQGCGREGGGMVVGEHLCPTCLSIKGLVAELRGLVAENVDLIKRLVTAEAEAKLCSASIAAADRLLEAFERAHYGMLIMEGAAREYRSVKVTTGGSSDGCA